MSREIRFRALAHDNKGNSEWFYYGPQERPQIPIKYPFIKIQDIQYTGLKDKNSKEIYEGDIDGSDEPMYVAFEEGSFGLKFKDKLDYFDPHINWWNCEIIGNIYENPERLNEELLEVVPNDR